MKSKNNKVILIVIAVLALVAIVAFFMYNNYVKKEKAGTPGDTAEIIVTVEQGEGVPSVAAKLKEKEVIANEKLFRKHASSTGKDVDFKYGDFIVNKAMSYDELCEVFTTEPTGRGNWFTVVEGKNLVEISEMVEKRKIGTKEAFIEAINKNYGFAFEEHLDDNELVLFKHEGFAFPDTYYVDDETTVEMLAEMMLENFDKKLTDKHYKRMDELGLNLRETIALASIIQEEAGIVEEMEKVSAVFHNRLKEGSGVPKLQSDVTVFYAQDIVKPRTKENKEMMEAYDTYDTEGISVGPISNPGMEAIEAALYPADVDYLYFLTDNTGKYYYANTLVEHEKYWEEALAVNKKLEEENN